jgi:lipoprotein
MKTFQYIPALLAAGIFTSCGALWDADFNVSPDYYNVGTTLPFYGYMPGPPPIDPSLWGPSWAPGPLIHTSIRPGGNGFNPGFTVNQPVGNIRPATPMPSTPAITPAGNARPSTGGGGGEIYVPGSERGRH